MVQAVVQALKTCRLQCRLLASCFALKRAGRPGRAWGASPTPPPRRATSDRCRRSSSGRSCCDASRLAAGPTFSLKNAASLSAMSRRSVREPRMKCIMDCRATPVSRDRALIDIPLASMAALSASEIGCSVFMVSQMIHTHPHKVQFLACGIDCDDSIGNRPSGYAFPWYRYSWNPANVSLIRSGCPRSVMASAMALYFSFRSGLSLPGSNSFTPSLTY